MELALSSPLTALPGVGPSRAEQLQQKGLAMVEDLLYYLPFRYEDRIHFTPVGDATLSFYGPHILPGQAVTRKQLRL